MLDILQLKIDAEEFDQLRNCQIRPPRDGHAAFTARSKGTIWPGANWGEVPAAERINVRGWFPVLDKIADEFLLWWPQGGCFTVFRDSVRYRTCETEGPGVLFLELEVNRPKLVPQPQNDVRLAKPVPRFVSNGG